MPGNKSSGAPLPMRAGDTPPPTPAKRVRDMKISQWFGAALAAVGALAGAGLGPAAAGSPLYPPELRARIVVVEPGIGLQRHYWDPRYCAASPWAIRHPWQCVAPPAWGQWYFSF